MNITAEDKEGLFAPAPPAKYGISGCSPRKKMQNLQTQKKKWKKKRCDTGWSLRGVLQLCLLIQPTGFTSATATLLRWSHLQQAETDPGGHVWTGAPPPPGQVSRSFWTRNAPQAAVWLSSLISTWVTCSPATSVGLCCAYSPYIHVCLVFSNRFNMQVKYAGKQVEQQCHHKKITDSRLTDVRRWNFELTSFKIKFK